MARSSAGATLTAQHRAAQLRVRAVALRDYTRLWPVWTGDDESFGRLADASLTLVRAYAGLSSSIASAYFTAFRTTEGVAGSAAPKLAAAPSEGLVVGTLHVTGRDAVRDAIRAGMSPQAARQNALVRTSGSVSRFVLNGGRDTIVQSAAADRRALGWARVTSGDPCAFCALIASNGPVYKQDTVDFEAHDHCSCVGEPFYPGSDWPGRGREFKDLYNQAQREARAAGDLKRGTSNDALNAFRRSLTTDRRCVGARTSDTRGTRCSG